MPEKREWSTNKSVNELPPTIRRYFLGEASSMYNQLAIAEVQIVEDKSSGYRPGTYGERRFHVVSTNPIWYRQLYQEYKPVRRKKRKKEREKEAMRKVIGRAEKGEIVILGKKRKRVNCSLNKRVLKSLDAIMHQTDISLPNSPRKNQPGLLQEYLRSLILDRLLTGYRDNIDGSVPPLEDMAFLRYFDSVVESGSYHQWSDSNGPDELSEEYPYRSINSTEDELHF